MWQKHVGGGRVLLAGSRLAIVAVAVGFTCVACSREGNTTAKKAEAPHTSGGTSAGAASTDFSFSGFGTNSNKSLYESHDGASGTAGGEPLDLTAAPGTWDGDIALDAQQGTIVVPQSLVDGLGPSTGNPFSDDPTGITGQITPDGLTPDASSTPLPSVAWCGLALLCGLGVAAAIKARRANSMTRQTVQP